MVANNERPLGPKTLADPKGTVWEDEYPFASNYFNVGTEAAPLWIHYVDEGPRDAPVIVMAHGNPTWSFFWRHVIKGLRSDFRCIAIDHMGCGMSDRPQQYDYTLAQHGRNLKALIEELQLDRFTLAMHDWGGMIGTHAAVTMPERIERMVVINTAAFLGRLPKRIRAVRIPMFGKAAVLGANAFVRAALSMCTVDKSKLTPAIKAGFTAPYQNPHDRIATLRFVEDVPLHAGHPTYNEVQRTDDQLHKLKHVPVFIAWGMQDWCFKPVFLDGWVARFPHAEVHRYDDGAHYLLEDHHQNVVPLIKQFLNGPDHVTAPAKSIHDAVTQPPAAHS